VTTLNVEVGPKRLELLNELVPSATIIALLVNPTNPVLADALLRDAQAAAGALGLQVHVLNASTVDEIETAFAALLQLRAGGLVIGSDQFFNSRSAQLAALALHNSVPAIYQYHEFAAAGGLMSYGGSLSDAFRLTGIYTGRKPEKSGRLVLCALSQGQFAAVEIALTNLPVFLRGVRIICRDKHGGWVI
jgi:putative ABC transport system substrate-binding protein